MPVLGILAVLVSLLAYMNGPASAVLNPVAASIVAGGTNVTPIGGAPNALYPTLPRGAAFIADNSGGHWWVGDTLGSFCRLDTGAGAGFTVPNGTFALAGCQTGPLKSAGAIVVGPGPLATQRYAYVADTSSRSTHVVRFTINISAGNNPATVAGSATFTAANVTQKGGGLAGGRPSALALFNVGASGRQDLLVGFLKSGDIIRLQNVNNIAGQPGAGTLFGGGSGVVANTSDGIGATAFARVGNDLYISEVGGLGGVSKVPDPIGVTRPPCTVASPCAATGTGSGIGFPGGMAYDGSRYLYVADARKGGASNYLYRLDTTNGLQPEVVSNAVPAYSANDSTETAKSFTSFAFPMAVGYNLGNGDIYVGDDPQFLAATPVNNQGHFWKVTAPPPPPAISSISAVDNGTPVTPPGGPIGGGTIVTITGTNLANGTVTFGGVPAVVAPGQGCTSATTCVVTSPTGSGTVDVVVSVGTQTSPIVAADNFAYAVPAGPAVTALSPATGDAAGGTIVTITGTNLTAAGGSTTVTFGGVAATTVNCASTTSCTATSPAGIGPVDVVVNNGVTSSAVVPADQFGYTPSITSLAPASGSAAGGDAITVTGNGFSTVAGQTTFNFGVIGGTNVVCASTTSCTVVSPAQASGAVDVTATVLGFSSPITAADQFTYNVPINAVLLTITPARGALGGGTVVTVTGNNLTGATFTFNGTPASFVSCTATLCTLDTPPATGGAAGAVAVVATTALGPSNPLQFTYVQATANLYAWGITAPKGGAVWLPGNLGGHWWSSDHAQGFCRQDAASNGLHALDFAVCGDDAVGSAGQGVYDPRPATPATPNLHYVYVPDNAVRSTAVWRLTFDATTETMVADPLDGVTFATAMTPLANVKTLKPNGMALGPVDAAGKLCDGLGVAGAGNCPSVPPSSIGLYVTDLVEKYVRFISNPNGDPRVQTVGRVAATGDGRGANGTAGFIGSYLYVSGNRATQFFDATACPDIDNTPGAPPAACGMASVPAAPGLFVAGTAVDPVHKLVYQSNSPGGAAAAILRYDASHDQYVYFQDLALTPNAAISIDLNGVVHCEAGGFAGNAGIGCLLGPNSANFLDGGNLPGPLGSPVVVATGPAPVGATRPWDTANHPTLAMKFGFAFGLSTGPANELIITEDPTAGNRSGRGTMWSVAFTDK